MPCEIDFEVIASTPLLQIELLAAKNYFQRVVCFIKIQHSTTFGTSQPAKRNFALANVFIAQINNVTPCANVTPLDPVPKSDPQCSSKIPGSPRQLLLLGAN